MRVIKFLQPYNTGEHYFSEGTLGRVSDSDAKTLVDAGIAEYYNANPDYSLETVRAVVEAEVGKLTKSGGRRPPFPISPGVYAEGFGAVDPKRFWLGETGGGSDFSNAAEFLKAVVKAVGGQPDIRLKDISEGTASEGGFLVPVEMANFIYSEILEDSPFFTMSTLLPMQSGSIKIPYVYDRSRSTASLHGITVPVSVGEGDSLADISPTFGQCELNLHKIGGRCRVSNEQLEDSSFAMSVLLPRLFAEALSFEMQRQFLAGSGAGQCLGILNAPATVTQAKESGQVADTIVYKNIVKMWSRLLPAAKKRAVWMFNCDTEVQIRTMSLSVGTGGSSVFVLNAASQLPETIFGRPVYFTELLPTLGDEGDAVVFNPQAYAIGRKPTGQLRIETSRDARFENDQTVFRAVARLDGQPLMSAAITPKNGSTTLSHFVKLAERAA